MKYKKTMYMHKSCTDKELLLLNTFNNKTIRVKGEKREEVEKCLNNPNEYPQNEVFTLLMENGFIIDEHINEYERAEELFSKYRLNNNRMLHLIILPTEDCNFRCWYCYEEHNKGKMSKTVSEAIIKYVEKRIEDYDMLMVGWFGGEPLKALDIIEELSEKFIKICKKYGKDYSASITTNGYLLTPTVFRKLLNYEVREYQITIDGTKQVHDKNRYLKGGIGTYDKIVANLRKIRDMFSGELFTIHLRTNINKEVYEKLDQHIQFLEKEFSNRNFAHLMKITWECGVKDEERVKNLLDQTILHEVLKKCRGSKLTFEMNMRQHFIFGQVCYGSNKHSFVIGADGNIYKCTIHMEDKDSIGILSEDGEMMLKNNLFLQWTEKSLNEKEYKKCETCSVYPICFGISCPNKNGDKVLICPAIMEYIDEFMQLFNSTESNYTFYDYELE